MTRPVLAPLVVLFGAALAGCGATDNNVTASKSIRYQVEYSGSTHTGLSHRALSVSYSTDDGLQEQQNVGLPWTTVVENARSGFTPLVKAQFYGYGTIACRIVADSEVIQERRSAEGPYPTVECKD